MNATTRTLDGRPAGRFMAMLLVLCAAACSSSGRQTVAERPLPFHAALLPVEVNARPGAPAGRELEEDTIVEDVRLAFDETAAT